MKILMLFGLVRLITSIWIADPCPNNVNRKRDEPIYGCLAIHGHTRIDTSYVTMDWIYQNYAHPQFSADSTECRVKESGYGLDPDIFFIKP